MIYNSAMLGEASGDIDFNTDDFSVLLVGQGYEFDRKAHTVLADISDEIVAEGYVRKEVEVTVTPDNVNDRVDIELGGAVWNPSTITAYGAVYFKAVDGRLVYFNDFEGPVTSTNAAFTLPSSTIRKQNT